MGASGNQPPQQAPGVLTEQGAAFAPQPQFARPNNDLLRTLVEAAGALSSAGGNPQGQALSAVAGSLFNRQDQRAQQDFQQARQNQEYQGNVRSGTELLKALPRVKDPAERATAQALILNGDFDKGYQVYQNALSRQEFRNNQGRDQQRAGLDWINNEIKGAQSEIDPVQALEARISSEFLPGVTPSMYKNPDQLEASLKQFVAKNADPRVKAALTGDALKSYATRILDSVDDQVHWYEPMPDKFDLDAAKSKFLDGRDLSGVEQQQAYISELNKYKSELMPAPESVKAKVGELKKAKAPAAAPSPDEKISVLSPEGKRGSIPKSQLEAALKKGFKLAE